MMNIVKVRGLLGTRSQCSLPQTDLSGFELQVDILVLVQGLGMSRVYGSAASSQHRKHKHGTAGQGDASVSFFQTLWPVTMSSVRVPLCKGII